MFLPAFCIVMRERRQHEDKEHKSDFVGAPFNCM